MMNAAQQYLQHHPDCEIRTRRTVNADQKTAWKAWADPAHLQNWWGPNGFTNSFHEHTLKPGGRWRFTMHGPEAGNYENDCVFVDIIEEELLVWDRNSQPLFRVVVLFEPVSDLQTHIQFLMIFATAEECSKLKKYVVDKNEENFDRLEEELAKIQSGV